MFINVNLIKMAFYLFIMISKPHTTYCILTKAYKLKNFFSLYALDNNETNGFYSYLCRLINYELNILAYVNYYIHIDRYLFAESPLV